MKSGLFYCNIDTDVITDLNCLINKAKSFGLEAEDIAKAKAFLKLEDYGVCIDFLLTQMFDYYIEVDRDFVDLAYSVLTRMGLDMRSYQYLDELCEDEI